VASKPSRKKASLTSPPAHGDDDDDSNSSSSSNNNQQVQTDSTIPNNKPDVMIRDNDKTCVLIDTAISGDRNVIKKEAEKILKYKDIIIEIQRMWKVKAKVIPIITGAPGTITKSLRQYLSNIPGKHKIKELQKTAILGIAHILRKVLMYTGEITLHVAQTVKTEQQ
jgi:hypothetical protein